MRSSVSSTSTPLARACCSDTCRPDEEFVGSRCYVALVFRRQQFELALSFWPESTNLVQRSPKARNLADEQGTIEQVNIISALEEILADKQHLREALWAR